ncbi:MAG: glycoside hydrolase family 31 protein [Bacteroides sp.]|jgi:alpha-glucosidase (family GH31 glycosyl hydrolase)|nr:glycoside hydrolase family 31 protein [Bacteroides sp.]MCI1683755.1 glycoside hydrolase family 31 protein [Bacteroides sp.]
MKSNSFVKLLSLFLLAFFNLSDIWGQEKASNVVYQDNNVRITLITDGTVRLEWEPDGRFIDNASFVAVNREYQPVNYRISDGKKKVEIRTAKIVLKYIKNKGSFSTDNLSIVSAKGMMPFKWSPGSVNNGNLKGTYRTLDGYDGPLHRGNNKMMVLEDGLLSTDGWTLIDDSNNYLFDHSDWPWVMERPNKNGQDWYFMAYGHDYKKALKDFTVFAGKVPLPPRYAFGYWWSRYWSYSDNELRTLVDDFDTYDIPLDVLVIDMDWHYTEPGKGGWTGYTWNKRLFPDPDGFLKYLKKNNLQVTLNLHPADGIASYETNFPAMAKWMGLNTNSTKLIPYEGSNKQFMSGWLNTILRPMEKKGVDFWWLDWQQRLNDEKFKNLSNTWWINYVVFSDMARNRDTRPLLYHRWGGLGNHRYQIGFSGDTHISWASLNFQPYFNSTASNVLYGYWSHDIGGHMGANSINPELYVRWLQFGALSPILRTHSTKNSNLNKEPWIFSPEYFKIIRSTILERYKIAPYVYTMARKTYDEALSLCRPMYYDYPEAKEAYDYKNEYMFGDNILVCPITAPMKDGKSVVRIWLPAGNDWYEWHTGTLLQGGQTIDRIFHLDEYPIYVKAGSVLPFYDEHVKNLRNRDEPIVVTVFPGSKGTFTLYEDNGNDKDYATQYATTLLTSEKRDNILTVRIAPRKGGYSGMPANRSFKVNVIASTVPENVSVNGKQADFSYDGNNLILAVEIPETNCSVGKVVEITYAADAPDVADGLYAKLRHVQQTILDLKKRQAGIVLTERLGTMESTGRAITYYPDQFVKGIEIFRKNYTNLPDVLKEQKLDQKTIDWFMSAVK